MLNKKTVYVIEAGFSKKVKCPLMPEFTNVDSFKWLKKRLNKKDKTRLEFLENYVLDRMALGYCHNIEEFLNHVSIGTAKNYLAKMASSLGELALYERKCSLPNCDGYHIYEKDKGKPTHQYF